MVKFRIICLFLLFQVTVINAQTDLSSAHFRALQFNLSGSWDARYSSFMLKPEVAIKALRGRIEFNGHYCHQLALLETWDKEIEDMDNALIGLGYNMPYNAYEGQLGFNFYRNYNSDATVSWGGGGVGAVFSVIRMEPGTRAQLVGAHGGFGGYRTKSGLYDQAFNLEDKRGNVFRSTIAPGHAGEDYRYDTYTNIASYYTFAGLHYNVCSKSNRGSRSARGGRVVRYYADLIFTRNTEVGNLYNPLTGAEFKAVPFEGDSWTKMGYRFGAKGSGSAFFSIHYGFEIGQVPNLGTYGTGDNSIYYSFNLGIALTPKVFPIDLDDY